MRIQNLILITKAILKGQDSFGHQAARLWRSFLPNIPRRASVRNTVADGTFVLLQLLSRLAYIVGAIIGAECYDFIGFWCGLVAGGIIGFWMRRSLGLRGRNITSSYFNRLTERGYERTHIKLLEWLVEVLRGERLSAFRCRQMASAYIELDRRLQSYDSEVERQEIFEEFHRKIMKAWEMEEPIQTMPEESENLPAKMS